MAYAGLRHYVTYSRIGTGCVPEETCIRRFIFTGAPGAGKTAIIRQLCVEGFSVVEEVATDLITGAQSREISKPWTDPSFIDAVARLQRDRPVHPAQSAGQFQFHDRSVACAAALAENLGYPFSSFLTGGVARIQMVAINERRGFFICNRGIYHSYAGSPHHFAEAVRFERIREEIYRSSGFELFSVGPAPLIERVKSIKAVIGQTGTGEGSHGWIRFRTTASHLGRYRAAPEVSAGLSPPNSPPSLRWSVQSP